MRTNPDYCSAINFAEPKAAPTAPVPEAQYLSLIIEFTKVVFMHKHTIVPVFIYEKDGNLQHVNIPASLMEPGSKEDLYGLIGSAVQAFQPDSYCFVAEAWAYKMDNFTNAEATAKALSDFKKGMPDTGITREEVVSLTFTKVNADKSVERWTGTVPFSRDDDDAINSFGSERWIKETASMKFKGGLVVP